MPQAKTRRGSPVIMRVAVGTLAAVTFSLGTIAVHGLFIAGWLLPYWSSMTDAQASIISQLIFFLAVAWGSLLVPLLFGSQLRSLEEAADKAQDTYDSIRLQLEGSIAESKRQFSSISRYQQMALGYFSNEGVFTDLDDDQKKAFVENAWHTAEPKVAEALKQLHGRTRQWVNAGGRYRSNPWWNRVLESQALRDCYGEFKAISDAKWSASKGSVPTFEQLKRVNDALRVIDEFEPAAEADVPEAVTSEQPPQRPTEHLPETSTQVSK